MPGAPIALKIRCFDGNDRPLHADVPIRQRFRLHAQTESARALQQLSLSRGPTSYDSDLASRLVGIPNRNHERPMTIFRNTDDGHMNVGQKCLPFFLRHRERHRRSSAARGVCCLSTVAIFCQPSILRNLICPLASRLKSSTTAVPRSAASRVGATNDHPDCTQEFPRKLLPTSAEETQRRRRKERELTRRCLWRVGSSLDWNRLITQCAGFEAISAIK